MSSTVMLTIGELAERAGTNAVTIRYYEKRKLIPSLPRSEGGHRLYPENLVPRLRFIQNAKLVGFSLDEIKELLALQVHPKASSEKVKNLTLTKLKIIQEKIAALQKIENLLQYLTNICDGKMPLNQCPILENLYGDIEEKLSHSHGNCGKKRHAK